VPAKIEGSNRRSENFQEQEIFSENEEKISYDAPLSSTDATSTSHIYEATIGIEFTLSHTNKRHGTNSIV
jgi:hypothetical protein